MTGDTDAVERAAGGTSLIDVLDRVLDKGIVIDAWVRVSLVGIDLITVEARVVVASIDTYLKYSEAVQQVAPVSRRRWRPSRMRKSLPKTPHSGLSSRAAPAPSALLAVAGGGRPHALRSNGAFEPPTRPTASSGCRRVFGCSTVSWPARKSSTARSTRSSGWPTRSASGSRSASCGRTRTTAWSLSRHEACPLR